MESSIDPENGKEKVPFFEYKKGMDVVRARDLVLYSHWPVKTARFFEILEEQANAK